jgi:hypothetical protein
VLLDFKAAFDSVWHNGLRMVLKSLNLPLCITRWLSDFIRNRSFAVSVDSIISPSHSIKCGVPQGSPLSPMLFVVFTASMLPSQVEISDAWKNVAKAAYADDVALWAVARPQACAVARLQNELKSIEAWTSKWRLSLNPAKCEAIDIGYPAGRAKVLVIKGHTIPWSSKVKYLGCWLTTRLSWKPQISQTIKKTNSRVAAFKALLAPPAKFDLKLAIIFYQGAIRSVIEFGLPIMGFIPPSLLTKLIIIEKKCLKAALGLHIQTPTIELNEIVKRKLPGFVPLQHRIDSVILKFGLSSLEKSTSLRPLILNCRENVNPTSKSPLRYFLKLLGNRNFPALIEQPIPIEMVK